MNRAIRGVVLFAMLVAWTVAASSGDESDEAARRSRLQEIRQLVESLEVSTLPQDAAQVPRPVELARPNSGKPGMRSALKV